jgi:hypothetical protein
MFWPLDGKLGQNSPESSPFTDDFWQIAVLAFRQTLCGQMNYRTINNESECRASGLIQKAAFLATSTKPYATRGAQPTPVLPRLKKMTS